MSSAATVALVTRAFKALKDNPGIRRHVLHWANWSEGCGVLLSGDFLQVVPSGHVSFMWFYPNLIPLSAAEAQRRSAASVARYIARISASRA